MDSYLFKSCAMKCRFSFSIYLSFYLWRYGSCLSIILILHNVVHSYNEYWNQPYVGYYGNGPQGMRPAKGQQFCVFLLPGYFIPNQHSHKSPLIPILFKICIMIAYVVNIIFLLGQAGFKIQVIELWPKCVGLWRSNVYLQSLWHLKRWSWAHLKGIWKVFERYFKYLSRQYW